MKLEENINDRRQIDKRGLKTFLFDKVNILDFDLDKLIASKLEDIEEIHLELCQINESPEKYKQISEDYIEIGMSLGEHEHDLVKEMQYFQDEAFVLYEVKIIYAYKHFEINLKKLISSAYRDISAKKIYQWNQFSQYLLSKNIDIKSVNSYKEINELREVNNALKHSGEISSDEIKKIPEFHKKDSFALDDMEKFYNRVNDSPNIFLAVLSQKIYQDLYIFDENKLIKMAKDFALRMDPDVAARFSEILKEEYK